MPYPTVSEHAARAWFKQWQDDCEAAGERITPSAAPIVEVREAGAEEDWDGIAATLVEELSSIYRDKGDKSLESIGATRLHEALPDHEALRDPEFWFWLASVGGRTLIEERYPFRPNDDVVQDEEASKKTSYLPARNNFVGESAKENFYFRLWIRPEMARHLEDDHPDVYEYARPGAIDFWRSHVFRQLFAHHRPFLHAWVDFQFPAPQRSAYLNTQKIRQLAKDLRKACANVQVEVLDVDQCRTLIQRVWSKTAATHSW